MNENEPKDPMFVACVYLTILTITWLIWSHIFKIVF